MSSKPFALALICLALGAAALPAGASASSRQLSIFQDDAQLLEHSESTQVSTLNEIRGLGADVIKAHVQWSHVAPAGTSKPAGFDPSNPAGYNWGALDSLVRNSQARGFQVMLALTGPAPGWATARRGDRASADRPSGSQYAKFAEAAGRHFPSVHIWVFWNEPNLARFLYPQSRGGVPYAPYLYRRLVSGGVKGLRASGHGSDRLLFGELLPIGKPRLNRRNSLKPLRFLREFFCVSSRWRKAHSRKRGCSGFRKVTGVNGFGYHPYTRPNGPRGKEPTRDDATIRSIRRITRTLDRAHRRGRLGGPRRMSFWNTEFGYQSNPPDPFQTRIGRIPGFL